MTISFYKYQGTGNDFIMIDDRSNSFLVSDKIISNLCDRRMGIGADGLILIKKHSNLDFKMVYYNGDGSQSLCGNGSRCAVNFAKKLNIITDRAKFLTVNGIYKATIDKDIINLNMKDISVVKIKGKDFFIDNGSPHHIIFTQNNKAIDVFSESKKIRGSLMYQPNSININFVEILSNNTINVRTFERGVENETLSCGTGVVASALAASLKNIQNPMNIQTKGGNLKVTFSKNNDTYFQNIVLSGTAKMVYKGEVGV